jgi:hypothetical protein
MSNLINPGMDSNIMNGDRLMDQFNEIVNRVKSYYDIGRLKSDEYIVQYGALNTTSENISNGSYYYEIISICKAVGGSHFTTEPVMTPNGYVAYYCIFSNVLGYNLFMVRNHKKYDKEDMLEIYN